MCHGPTNCELWQSTDDEAMTNKAANMELEVTRRGTLEAASDRVYELRKLGLAGEHEGRDEG